MSAAPGDHVAVVIPALDEAGSLGGVLAAIAPESCGLPVEVIVVDDGSTDGTGDLARAGGAHVLTMPTNQGQGAAFQAGYRLAGAETDDGVRALGVRVFSALVRLLTGVRVSDTSSGLRAMRAEITAVVRQEQPQYQSSELLIGAIAHGYRVAERPTVMHRRLAGHSKKGGNVLYGARYARVVLRTWWRERRAARSGAAASPAVAIQRLDG